MIKVGLIKEEVIQMNLEFVNKFLSDKLPELYLFCRLRLFCAKSGGKFTKFDFSKNERYNILPKLVDLGWVDIESNKINKYRTILTNADVKAQASFTLDKLLMKSLKTFKAIILATNERYLLDVKEYRKSEHPLLKVEKIKSDGNVSIKGRVFNAELSRIMGVSIPTISRWRAESIDEGFNEYDMRAVKINRSSIGSYKSDTFIDRIAKGSYFINIKDGAQVTKDLIITSTIKMFYAVNRHIDFERSFVRQIA